MNYRLGLIIILLLAATGCKRAVSYEHSVNKSLHTKRVGESAKDMLTSARYTGVAIEVQYMAGYEPDSAALVNLTSFLDGLLHKPDGISITTKQIATAADTVLTTQEIIALEDANRRRFTDSTTLSLYILFTNGYATDRKMLGMAYRNTSVAIFGKNIRSSSDIWGRLSKGELETRVLQHEMGHLLGLTNLTYPATAKHSKQHKDIHCSNKQCLMYSKMETTDYPAYLLKKERPSLDENCMKILEANGGKKNGLYYVSLKKILEN